MKFFVFVCKLYGMVWYGMVWYGMVVRMGGYRIIEGPPLAAEAWSSANKFQ